MVVAHVSLGRKIQLDTHIESHNHGTEEKREKKTRRSTSVILLKGTIECHKNKVMYTKELQTTEGEAPQSSISSPWLQIRPSSEPLHVTPREAVISGGQSDREFAGPRASQQFYGKS